MIIEDKAISSTALVKNADKQFTRAQLLTFLKRNQLIDEQEEPTKEGRKYGISQKAGPYGIYLTFDMNFQKIVERYLSTIAQIQAEEKKSLCDPQKLPDLRILSGIPFDGYQHMNLGDFLVLDTETTGLTHEDEVIELGITDSRGNTLYQSFFSHEVPVHPAAAQVNHITETDLRDAPCIGEEYERIMSIIDGKTILGHNISFDERLLKQSFQRYGIDFPGFYATKDSRDYAKKYIKTRSYKLENLSNLLGIPGEERHRAVDDCMLTIQMLQNLEKLLHLSSILK